MTDQYLPAIDIGTGNARAVLFTRTGQQVGMTAPNVSGPKHVGWPES